jgi:1-acyl-sn-glycerol-3-phosphate acyltransferase
MGKRLARQLRRAVRLAALSAAAAYGLWEHRKLPRDASRAESAEWLHESCVRGLSAINVQLSTIGPSPSFGLVVSNHLSYLDILILSGAMPCVFVSKAEVERWPIFGRYARWAGSVFVRRHDRADAARANVSVAESLQNGVPVVLFPEGTTTDGKSVLPFHSTMLQPAIDSGAQVTPCWISYKLDDGAAERDVCWWGDMPLLPHALNLLGKKTIRATIAFGNPLSRPASVNRLASLCVAKYFACTNSYAEAEETGRLLPAAFIRTVETQNAHTFGRSAASLLGNGRSGSSSSPSCQSGDCS